MRAPGYVYKRRCVVLFTLFGDKKAIGKEVWVLTCGEHPEAYVHEATKICDQCWEEGRYRFEAYSELPDRRYTSHLRA